MARSMLCGRPTAATGARPASFDEHENIREDLLEVLRGEVRVMGLFSPQMPRERGGLGLGLLDRRCSTSG